MGRSEWELPAFRYCSRNLRYLRAAHGLQGAVAFFAAQGWQAPSGFLAAQGLHAAFLAAPQGF